MLLCFRILYPQVLHQRIATTKKAHNHILQQYANRLRFLMITHESMLI